MRIGIAGAGIAGAGHVVPATRAPSVGIRASTRSRSPDADGPVPATLPGGSGSLPPPRRRQCWAQRDQRRGGWGRARAQHSRDRLDRQCPFGRYVHAELARLGVDDAFCVGRFWPADAGDLLRDFPSDHFRSGSTVTQRRANLEISPPRTCHRWPSSSRAWPAWWFAAATSWSRRRRSRCRSAFARDSYRMSTLACTSSIGGGATNVVTARRWPPSTSCPCCCSLVISGRSASSGRAVG